MSKIINLEGQKFGRLTAVSPVRVKSRREIYWQCLCECGAEIIVRSSHLRTGATTSCGCYRREQHLKHGHTIGNHKTPEYKAWQNMIKRCEYVKDVSYPEYGGRGIKVCESWRNNFESFLTDMGYRPTNKHSIDRIDTAYWGGDA